MDQNINDNQSIIYNANDGFISKKIPLIRMNTNGNNYAVILRNKNNNIQLMQGTAPINTNRFLSEIFVQLNLEANRSTCRKFKIYRNDIIFDTCQLEQFKSLGNKWLKNISIAIIEPPEEVSDKAKQMELIEVFHKHPIFGGHIGKKRLYHKLRQKYNWKNMSRDVATFVKKCHQCQINKTKCHTKIPMCITDTPNRPFEKISIDTVGPLPITENGNKYAVTISCNLTKYFIPIPLPNKDAKTIAQGIVEHVFLIFGLSKIILTDMGTEYNNTIFNEILKILNIEHTTSTPYHPQTLGGVERSHKTLNEYLRTYLLDNNNEWDTYIKYFAFCYNTTPNSTFNCQFSPFELLFGKTPSSLDITNNDRIDPVYNIEDYSKELKYKIQTSNKLAKNLLIETKKRNKQYHDMNCHNVTFQINDKILALSTNHKLESVYDGPYTIIDQDQYNVTIQNDHTNKIRKLHKNRIVKYNT